MLIITGMHRSGTSLVARLFFKAGADMGDPSRFYPGDRWNPDGYYEQPDVHSVNMPLIHGRWGRLAYLSLPTTATILVRADRLGDSIRSLAAHYQDKVVKDARFCLTLPAWAAQGAAIRGVVVCLRHPHSVVESIRKRNHVPRWYAYRLWRMHLERLLENVESLPTWYVRYESLLNADRFPDELQGALEFSGLDAPSAALKNLQAMVVRPELDHSANQLTASPADVELLWNRLLAAHAKQCEPSMA